MNDVRVFESIEKLAHAVADCLQHKITSCVAEKGECHVVLPGGTTPLRSLQLLSDKTLPWSNVHWYVSDERCYPVGHNERNDTMIENALFSKKKNSISNFHPISAELGPELAAQNYALIIDSILDKSGALDISLLGMGEDGHTASLFPENKALEDARTVVPVYRSPKAPDERVSIGLSTLRNSNYRIVISTGESKHEILHRAMNECYLPVSQINADIWFVDDRAFYKNS